MKKFTGIVLAILLLTGCAPEKPVGVFKGVKVSDMSTSSRCGRCSRDFNYIFTKGDQKVSLRTSNKDLADTIQIGSRVDVYYTKEYEISKIEFVGMK